MEEAWERAVEAALEGKATSPSEVRVLNLDGAVKSLHGCLPPAALLERFPNLEHLSVANVGAPSLEKFPRLRNLQRLILSDNRIAGGLESLVDAGLQLLRDLDLSNNRIQYIDDLTPLAEINLVSLDLYECPVTRVNDYRSKVFSMIRTLRYLDKLDANGNERPESDDEDDEDDEDEYDDEEEDPGSGEVDGADQSGKLTVAAADFVGGDDGIVDADEDDESDADEEETETGGRGSAHGSSRGSGHHLSNGYRPTAAVGDEDNTDDDEEEDEDDDLGEEIDEEADDETVDIHHILDSDDDNDDGVDEAEPDEEEIDEDDNDDDELDENDDELGVGANKVAEPGNTSRLASTDGEIDGHELGEENENGEIGEEDEHGVGDKDNEVFGDDEDEDDLDDEYLVQPVTRTNRQNTRVGNEEIQNFPNNVSLNRSSSPSLASSKRSRDEGHLDNGDDADDDVDELRLPKRHE